MTQPHALRQCTIKKLYKDVGWHHYKDGLFHRITTDGEGNVWVLIEVCCVLERYLLFGPKTLGSHEQYQLHF